MTKTPTLDDTVKTVTIYCLKCRTTAQVTVPVTQLLFECVTIPPTWAENRSAKPTRCGGQVVVTDGSRYGQNRSKSHIPVL